MVASMSILLLATHAPYSNRASLSGLRPPALMPSLRKSILRRNASQQSSTVWRRIWLTVRVLHAGRVCLWIGQQKEEAPHPALLDVESHLVLQPDAGERDRREYAA